MKLAVALLLVAFVACQVSAAPTPFISSLFSKATNLVNTGYQTAKSITSGVTSGIGAGISLGSSTAKGAVNGGLSIGKGIIEINKDIIYGGTGLATDIVKGTIKKVIGSTDSIDPQSHVKIALESADLITKKAAEIGKKALDDFDSLLEEVKNSPAAKAAAAKAAAAAEAVAEKAAGMNAAA